MTVYESDIPGVGRKYELEIGGGRRAVVLVHHDGRREVFVRPSPEADSERVFDLTAAAARELSAMLQSTDFETVDVDALSVPLGEAIIEWVTVAAGSALDGDTVGEAAIRSATGASVVAVQRDEETIPNPASDLELTADDILVAIGTREEQAALADLAGAG